MAKVYGKGGDENGKHCDEEDPWSNDIVTNTGNIKTPEATTSQEVAPVVFRIAGSGEVITMHQGVVKTTLNERSLFTRLTNLQKRFLALCLLLAFLLACVPLMNAAADGHQRVTWVFLIPFLMLIVFFFGWAQGASGCWTPFLGAIRECFSCFPDEMFDYAVIEDLSHIEAVKDIYCGIMVSLKIIRLPLIGCFLWDPVDVYPTISWVLLIDFALLWAGMVTYFSSFSRILSNNARIYVCNSM